MIAVASKKNITSPVKLVTKRTHPSNGALGMTSTFTFKIETTKRFGQVSHEDVIQDQVDVKYLTNPARNITISLGLGRTPSKRRNDAASFTFLDKTEFVSMIVEVQGNTEIAVHLLSFLQRFLQANEDHHLPTRPSEWQELMANLVLRMNEAFFTNSSYMNSRCSLSSCYLRKNTLSWASIGKNHVFHFDLNRKIIDPFRARLNYPKNWFLPSDFDAAHVKEQVQCGHIPLAPDHVVIIATDGVIAIKGGIEIMRSQDLFQVIRHKRTALAAAHSLVKEIKEKRGGTESFSFLVLKT